MTALDNWIVDSNITDMLSSMELEDTNCVLKHNDDEEHSVVDFLCQNFGRKLENGEETIEHELRIPICVDCVRGLYDDDWLLFYCVRCNENQWLNRSLAKREYPKTTKIVWFDTCPHCHNPELDEVY